MIDSLNVVSIVDNLLIYLYKWSAEYMISRRYIETAMTLTLKLIFSIIVFV